MMPQCRQDGPPSTYLGTKQRTSVFASRARHQVVEGIGEKKVRKSEVGQWSHARLEHCQRRTMSTGRCNGTDIGVPKR